MTAKHIAMARAGKRLMKRVILRIPLWLVYAVGFMPAISYFYFGVVDELGADPMKTLERALGLWALRFLIACLTITPLRESFGINLLRYRRQIGLLAFCYALLHLTVYTVLDQGLDVSAIVADIVKRPYITIGMAAFALLGYRVVKALPGLPVAIAARRPA